jgi:outer membrane receptor protein involved in Fe transport
MTNRQNLQQAVRWALATVTATAAVPALHAQTAPAQAEAAAAPLAEVVVTGSRIKTPNETAISPITTVSATDIQETGLTRVEDVLNNLPMVFAGMNSTVSNGSTGTATVDLRGLGANRTLVLVNSRRLGPGDATGNNSADINQIPTALIERVDVLTGGASSVYGADAVAGVVNFILNTHFEGVKIDTTYDFYQHNNNDSSIQSVVTAAGDTLPPGNVNTGFDKTVSILVGSNFADNKGNATAYMTYDNQAATLESQYDYSACTLGNVNGAGNPFGGYVCGGSGTSAHGEFLGYGNKGAIFDDTVDPTTGVFRPFTNADLYNYGAINYYLRPNERWTAGTFVNYDINSHVTGYMDIMWTRNNSSAQIAASGAFFTSVFVPCVDPLMTAQEESIVCAPGNAAAQAAAGLQTSETVNGTTYPGTSFYLGRRNVEGLAPRTTIFTSNSIHLTTGIKGDFGDAWTYDVYAQRSTVDDANDTINYLSEPGVIAAINVITGPALLPNGLANPNAGKPECVATYTGTSTNCVPWNVWHPGGVTPSQLASLYVPLLDEGNVVENVVSGSVTGDLSKYGVKLPTADDGMQLNVGAEYRSEYSNFSPDELEQEGTLAAEGVGGASTPQAGDFHVSELFTEMNLPLVQHAPFADSLAMDAGYRYSSYTIGFNTSTYKLGLEWAPVKDIRFRTSYQRAVRAPNILELFQPQTGALDGTEDPCAGATPAYSPAQCAHTGVSAAQYGHIGPNPAGQYNGVDGGNPDLKPEVADTYGVGFVLQPRVLPNLSVSVDYFDIKIKDVINTIGENTILNDCATTGNPFFCTLIHRSAGNGSLWLNPYGTPNAGYAFDVTQNLGSLSTKGVDVKASYRQPLPALGSLFFSLEGTYLDSLASQPLPGGASYDCVGLFGGTCGAPNSKWRHVVNATWSTPWDALNMTLRWRYIGSADSQETSSNPQLSGVVPGVASVPAYNYLDMTADWALYKSIRMQVGINNIFDKNPPLFIGTDCPVSATGPAQSDCNGNTFAGTYDALGRYIFIHLSAQF